MSIFDHNLRSCSGVKSGGGGNVDSPPKSTAVLLGTEAISNTASDSFSSAMASVGS